MAVTVEGTPTQAFGTASSLTFSYTAGGNGLFVGIASQGSPPTITSVTFNADPMVELWDVPSDDTIIAGGGYIMVAPDAGAHNVVITISETPDLLWGAAVGLDGLDQTTPNRTVYTENLSTTSPAAVTVADSESGDLVIESTTCNVSTITVGSGQTVRAQDNAIGGGGQSAGTSTEPASGANTVMSWTFAGGPLRLVVGATALVASAGGVDNLTADGISVTPVLGTPILGQEHALGATGIAVTPEVGNPIIGQEHALDSEGISAAPVVGNPILGEVHALESTGISVSPVVGNPVIGQEHALESDGISVDPSVGNPIIGQAHALTSVGISVAPSVGNPILAEGVHILTSVGISVSPSVGNPVVGQEHALASVGISVAPSVGNPILAVNVDNLISVGISVSPSVGNPILGQAHALVAEGITVAPVLGTPTLAEAAAVGLATMTFAAKIPGMSIATAQPTMDFASSQPRMEITDE